MTKLSNSPLARMMRLQKLFSNRRKWVRDEWVARKANHTCYCLVGGINKVSGLAPQGCYTAPAMELTKLMGFQGPNDAISWNDDYKRTVGEVQQRVAFGVKNARKLARDPNYQVPDYAPESK